MLQAKTAALHQSDFGLSNLHNPMSQFLKVSLYMHIRLVVSLESPNTKTKDFPVSTTHYTLNVSLLNQGNRQSMEPTPGQTKVFISFTNRSSNIGVITLMRKWFLARATVCVDCPFPFLCFFFWVLAFPSTSQRCAWLTG